MIVRQIVEIMGMRCGCVIFIDSPSLTSDIYIYLSYMINVYIGNKVRGTQYVFANRNWNSFVTPSFTIHLLRVSIVVLAEWIHISRVRRFIFSVVAIHQVIMKYFVRLISHCIKKEEEELAQFIFPFLVRNLFRVGVWIWINFAMAQGTHVVRFLLLLLSKRQSIWEFFFQLLCLHE